MNLCRTCLQQVDNVNCLTLNDDPESLRVRTELELFIPEMMYNLVVDPVLCLPCVSALHAAYDFKRCCLHTEQLIVSWMRTNQKREGCVNLVEAFGSNLQHSNVDVIGHNPSKPATNDFTNTWDGLVSDALCRAKNHPEELQSNSQSKNDLAETKSKTTIHYLPNLRLKEELFTDEGFEERVDHYILKYPQELLENQNNKPDLTKWHGLVQQCSVAVTKLPDSTMQCKIENTSSTLDSTTALEEFQKKEKLVRRKQLYKCDLCEFSSTYKVKLQKHKSVCSRKHHLQYSVRTYSASTKYITKDQIHGEDKPAGQQKGTKTIRMGIPSKELSLKCEFCIYRTATKFNLQRHMKRHLEGKPFKCSICDYRATHKFMLKEHIKIHTGEKPFKCYVCGYGAVKKSTLNNHMRVHTGEKPFKCSVCDFRTAQKCAMPRHMRIHTGEKPFKCETCGYRAAQKSRLISHIRMHTGEKPFKCNVCDFRAADKWRVRYHMGVHGGELPFKCSVCKYMNIYRSKLVQHMKIHNPGIPSKCSV